MPYNVCETTEPNAFGWNMQRSSWYAAGRYWILYVNNGWVCCRTSDDDGVTWSAEEQWFMGIADGELFSAWYDGTYVYVVFPTGGASVGYYVGQPETDGTCTDIIWDVVATGGGAAAYYPFISVDSNSLPWIGYLQVNGAQFDAYVMRSTTTPGWTMDAAFPIRVDTGTDFYHIVQPLPLTNGSMYILYERMTNTIGGYLYTVAGGLGAYEQVSTDNFWYQSSAVSMGDDVHLVYQRRETASQCRIMYVKRTGGVGWGTETAMTNLGNLNYYYFQLSKDAATGNVYLFYRDLTGAGGAPSLSTISWNALSDGSWIGSGSFVTEDSGNEIQQKPLLFSNYIGDILRRNACAWVKAAGGIYTIRFAPLSLMLAPEYISAKAL